MRVGFIGQSASEPAPSSGREQPEGLPAAVPALSVDGQGEESGRRGPVPDPGGADPHGQRELAARGRELDQQQGPRAQGRVSRQGAADDAEAARPAVRSVRIRTRVP